MANEKRDVKGLCFELVISKRHVIQISQAGIFFIQLVFIGCVCFFICSNYDSNDDLEIL